MNDRIGRHCAGRTSRRGAKIVTPYIVRKEGRTIWADISEVGPRSIGKIRGDTITNVVFVEVMVPIRIKILHAIIQAETQVAFVGIILQIVSDGKFGGSGRPISCCAQSQVATRISKDPSGQGRSPCRNPGRQISSDICEIHRTITPIPSLVARDHPTDTRIRTHR